MISSVCQKYLPDRIARQGLRRLPKSATSLPQAKDSCRPSGAEGVEWRDRSIAAFPREKKPSTFNWERANPCLVMSLLFPSILL